jgi:DNA topoisomerase-1
MVVLNIKNSRFLGCSRYPQCKFTKSLSTGVKCPEEGCDGELIERNTKRGKLFFGCSRYPACHFATWDRPIDQPCPECGCAIIVHKETKRKGSFNRCPKCKTEFPLSPAGGAEEDAA